MKIESQGVKFSPLKYLPNLNCQCRQSLGYCPQFDALDPLLTGREHLRWRKICRKLKISRPQYLLFAGFTPDSEVWTRVLWTEQQTGASKNWVWLRMRTGDALSKCVAVNLFWHFLLLRCAGTYSGGNKRKLSTAIALIGNPSIVFLVSNRDSRFPLNDHLIFRTSRPAAWTRGRGGSSGTASLRWSGRVRAWCSPPTAWRSVSLS